MIKQKNIKNIILSIYLIIIFGIFAWLIIPTIIKPKYLTPTNIPSLSLSGLREASLLFTNFGKEWVGYPEEPNISVYTFGQTDPIQ
jgi:uncharacterized protein with PQ loop repeat